jgi:type IV pilus assembly protein PilE
MAKQQAMFQALRGRSARGITLIELVVAMAILAILAAVAIPNYSDYVRRGTRADVQAFLMDVALRQQQHLVDRRSYAATLGALGVTVPSSIAGKYDVALVVDNAAAPQFTLTATPQGGQDGEACGALSLDAAGNKTPAKCW